jgi:mono/diheme cytochrome c family protein
MKSFKIKTVTLTFIVSVSMLSATLLAFTFPNKPWVAPEKFEKMKNPVKSDASSIADGKTLYGTHCASCHGKKGKGDGSKAAQLETECGDFTTPAFQKETDGAIFYKMTEGRKDMPTFAKKIADESERWAVINYLRTLK